MNFCRIHKFTALLAVLALVSVGRIFGQTNVPSYQVIDLGTLAGSVSSFANDINNNGEVVGRVLTDTQTGNLRAFRWVKGSMQSLAALPGTGGYQDEAYAINEKGEIVGSSGGRACLWRNNSIQGLGSLGPYTYDYLDAGGNYAKDINENSQIVGYDHTLDTTGWYPHGFLWSGGAMQDLGVLQDEHADENASYPYSINNGGGIVGVHSFVTESRTRGILWMNGVIQDAKTVLGGTNETWPLSINDAGQIAGISFNTHATYRPFLWSNGVLKYLPVFTRNPNENVSMKINNQGQIITSGLQGGPRAFLYQNGVRYILDNLVSSNISPGWNLEYAAGINDKGQIVGTGRNPSNQVRAFLLNPLPIGWKETITNQPVYPIYGTLPTREEGKDNLILVTHGWNPDVTWLRAMTNSIGQYLVNNNLTNWQVVGYEWLEGAQILKREGGPQTALQNGKRDGFKLGRRIVDDEWSHVHFIAHSAGSGLINAASEVIYTNVNVLITIQNTFLDPFVGLLHEEADKYGKYADWADNYFSKGDLPDTQSILPHAYNVDVTQLNKEKRFGAFISAGLNVGDPCEEVVAAHSWPYGFYANTVSGSVNSEYQGFGFPLSKEAGGWNYAIANYAKGSSTKLGSPEPQCISFVQENQGSARPVVPTSVASYKIGNVTVNPNGIQMFTQSPSWISMAVNPTNTVNFVSFELRFTSTNSNAKGLVSVYWDADLLASIDEQAVLPGLKHYVYSFPNASANSTHMLGFRIDPFTNIQSSVSVTNILLGLAGPSESFTLSATTNVVSGNRVLELKGQPGFNYAVEASTNLVNWETIAWLVNTNGSVKFYDQSSMNFKQRFYRAVVSP